MVCKTVCMLRELDHITCVLHGTARRLRREDLVEVCLPFVTEVSVALMERLSI